MPLFNSSGLSLILRLCFTQLDLLATNQQTEIEGRANRAKFKVQVPTHRQVKVHFLRVQTLCTKWSISGGVWLTSVKLIGFEGKKTYTPLSKKEKRKELAPYKCKR